MSEFEGPTDAELAAIEVAEVEGCPEGWVPSEVVANPDAEEVSRRG